MAGRVMALMSGLALAACSVVGIREVEEPKYTVVGVVGTVEIRAYGPRIAAEVLVGGDEIAARSAGFNKIAGYIFGGNATRAKIAMTAPVAQEAASEKIAMTAPVAQERGPDGRWRIRFFMPAAYAMAQLPVPNDPDVVLTEVPGATMAVLRFSGSRDAAAVADAERRVVSALAGSAWRVSGAAVAWFYDPPWTLPFLRRNEVAIPVVGDTPTR